MTVTSGPRTERIVRNGIFMLMCLGMGGWFAYDGYVGYLHQNYEKNLLQLDPDDRPKADSSRVYVAANMENKDAIAKVLSGSALDDRHELLETFFGGPPTLENDSAVHYFGQDGLVKVKKSGRRLTGPPMLLTSDGMKSLTSIQWQKNFGLGLGAFGLAMAVFLIRVMRTRASVTDKGLSINGKPPIPFDAMKSLGTDEFRKKGRVYINCESDKDRPLLLDEYHLADFDKIMVAICERTGFEDPVAAERREKEEKAASA